MDVTGYITLWPIYPWERTQVPTEWGRSQSRPWHFRDCGMRYVT